ncbi:hypothetical protein [Gracilibacillus salitolerans]|uniref:hypothetical protein n=1 Tax=Gracilibacillus salitolerans TaxID=2663022 RepID=UPI001891DB8A|nr:hypothetical protein [Gracilibacillus salitolerans]
MLDEITGEKGYITLFDYATIDFDKKIELLHEHDQHSTMVRNLSLSHVSLLIF